MPSLDHDGVSLDFDLHGDDGPAVVALHGLTSSREREGVLGTDLARGLTGCRVLHYDARGHGRSTGTTDPATYSWPRLALDLLALLDHVFPGETVHGAGPSMGTGTLLHAAVQDPARFAGLTLVVPPTAWETRVAQRAAYEQSARVVETEGVDALVRLGAAQPRPPAVDPGIPVTWPSVPDALLPTVLRGAALTDLPDPAEVARIDVATLLLAWTGDPTHPTSTAERLAGLMPHSELVVGSTPADVRRWHGLLAARLGVGPTPLPPGPHTPV